MKLLSVREPVSRAGSAREPSRRGGPRAAALVPLAAAVLSALIAACGGSSPRYEAEKTLFEARRMREQLVRGESSQEFIDRTVETYRSIVERYAGETSRVEGLGEIVVSAQMELAEFEFRMGRLDEAVADFDKAYQLAESEPAARANALYSTAFISEVMEAFPDAIRRYESFHREFLTAGSVNTTARMNPRYLITPLKLADLHARAGNGEQFGAWLAEAERTYREAIAGSEDSALVKEMQFNLLTTYLKGERWNDAHALVRDLEVRYANERDLPGLLFIEAKIQRDGFGKTARALEILQSIYERYPQSQEAVNARMTAAGIHLRAGRHDEAQRMYRSVVDAYGERDARTVEASWQLAQLAESRGNWVDASLQYKLVYTNHPGTIQGLEAPLRIASYYRDRNEREAAASAYERALEHYENLVSSQVSEEIRVMVEEYVIRALAEQGKWREASERLLELPDRYPAYRRFRENYLRAASIHERELNDPQRAAEILKDCMNRYPGTDLAAEADKQYKRITGVR